jgi:CubicO group peptidase (beta-lactamase class C family)
MYILIFRQIRYMKATAGFRSDAYYNNIIYSLVGHVIERLADSRSAVTWERLIIDMLIKRLNMMETSFYHDRDDPDQFAAQYVHNIMYNNTRSVLFNHSLLRSDIMYHVRLLPDLKWLMPLDLLLTLRFHIFDRQLAAESGKFRHNQ